MLTGNVSFGEVNPLSEVTRSEADEGVTLPLVVPQLLRTHSLLLYNGGKSLIYGVVGRLRRDSGRTKLWTLFRIKTSGFPESTLMNLLAGWAWACN